jgi:rare lipoprotein A
MIISLYRFSRFSLAALLTLACAISASNGLGAESAAPATSVESAPTLTTETGLAAVYSDKLHGHRTASGQKYDRNKLTAAHKTLPFGTKVQITNKKNNKSVVVSINDRGPVQLDRVLDISPRAARALGISRTGMGEVHVQVLN